MPIDIGILKEAIKNNDNEHISWVKSNEKLADSLTKSGVSSVPLVNLLQEGKFGPTVTAYLFSISKHPEWWPKTDLRIIFPIIGFYIFVYKKITTNM